MNDVNKKAIVLHLQLHQPYRLRKYDVFEIGKRHNYWDRRLNREVFCRVVKKSYEPMLEIIEQIMQKNTRFRFSLSITGVWLEQALEYAPEVITKIQKMVKTGRLELLGETYDHSLAFFQDREEFLEQVLRQREIVRRIFGVLPQAFRNTELAYNDELARKVEEMGFKTILAEGVRNMGWANWALLAKGCQEMRVLCRNYSLSDMVAFRFSELRKTRGAAESFAGMILEEIARGGIANLFMDFETFGEHQWQETGIFRFFEDFVELWGEKGEFLMVSEARERSLGEIFSVIETTTWADKERDLSAWLGNAMQKEAMVSLYGLRKRVLRLNEQEILEDFQRLTTSDHFYYMATKGVEDMAVHNYFSPYRTADEAFLNFMNVLRDLEIRVRSLENQAAI